MKEIEKSKPKKLRKDDQVLVIAGNSRGKSGKIMKIVGDKVYIQGVNLRKKHVKATRTTKGAIVEMERPIHISNLKLMDGGKAVKLRVRVNENGKRELYYKNDKESVVYRTLSR